MAKEFACYSRVPINFQTIVPGCLAFWWEDRQYSFEKFTVFQICLPPKTEGLSVTLEGLIGACHFVALTKEIDCQGDDPKVAFLGLQTQTSGSGTPRKDSRPTSGKARSKVRVREKGHPWPSDQ